MRHFEYVDPRLKTVDEEERRPQRSLGIAEMLEIIPGIFQTFGLGHFYARNWKVGIMLMSSYWFAFVANLILLPFGIGLISLPLTWLIFLVVTTQQLFAYARNHPELFEI